MKSEDVYKYVITNGLKISPAYEMGFGVSGECMCSAYAGRDEKMLIRKHDPDLFERIKWMEDGVQRFGTPRAKRYSHWGEGAAMSDLEQQQVMDDFLEKNPDLKIVNEIEELVCGDEGCGSGTMRGTEDY